MIVSGSVCTFLLCLLGYSSGYTLSKGTANIGYIIADTSARTLEDSFAVTESAGPFKLALDGTPKVRASPFTNQGGVGGDSFARVNKYYEPMYHSRSFRTCLKKIHSCRTTTHTTPKVVCLEHSETQHTPDRLSKTHPPREVVWNRTCSVDQCGLVLIGAEQAQHSRFLQANASGYCKILFHVEPEELCPSRQNFERYVDAVDIILSHMNPSGFSSSVTDKLYPFLYGSSWIQLEDIGLYPKRKLISIIASSKEIISGHKLRHELIKKYGRHLDVFGAASHSRLDDKIMALKDHRYSVIVENSIDKYWFTEKLVDAFLTGTVPIYWGAPAVAELFDMQGVLTFADLNDFERVLQVCSDIDYISRLGAVNRNMVLAKSFLNPELVLEQFMFKPLHLLPLPTRGKAAHPNHTQMLV